MKHLENVTDVLADLQTRGYVYDFSLRPDCLYCEDNEQSLNPDQFIVTEVYHFENLSELNDLAEEAMVYAVESIRGMKGIIVDPYNAGVAILSDDMLSQLRAITALEHN